MTLENRYLENKRRIMREIKFAIPHYKKFLVQADGMDVAEAVVQETLQRFEDLLPNLPYIGGDENILTENLYISAAMLAMYQSLKARGKSVEEVADVIYQGTSNWRTILQICWQNQTIDPSHPVAKGANER